ncbi:MAG: hypothetical protein H0V96_02890, partial [Acidimicrobiia bacterium]|nr:hypothetical protein [Acidimicrobiia bacterium]
MRRRCVSTSAMSSASRGVRSMPRTALVMRIPGGEVIRHGSPGATAHPARAREDTTAVSSFTGTHTLVPLFPEAA